MEKWQQIDGDIQSFCWCTSYLPLCFANFLMDNLDICGQSLQNWRMEPVSLTGTAAIGPLLATGDGCPHGHEEVLCNIWPNRGNLTEIASGNAFGIQFCEFHCNTEVKGIMCNWLVCMAVWLCTMAKDCFWDATSL